MICVFSHSFLIFSINPPFHFADVILTQLTLVPSPRPWAPAKRPLSGGSSTRNPCLVRPSPSEVVEEMQTTLQVKINVIKCVKIRNFKRIKFRLKNMLITLVLSTFQKKYTS